MKEGGNVGITVLLASCGDHCFQEMSLPRTEVERLSRVPPKILVVHNVKHERSQKVNGKRHKIKEHYILTKQHFRNGPGVTWRDRRGGQTLINNASRQLHCFYLYESENLAVHEFTERIINNWNS
jgi:hypothetical protein